MVGLKLNNGYNRTVFNIFMFGGRAEVRTGLGLKYGFQNDVWTMQNGCLAGMHGLNCENCSDNSYKEVTSNLTEKCTKCPLFQTTNRPGSTSEHCALYLWMTITLTIVGTSVSFVLGGCVVYRKEVIKLMSQLFEEKKENDRMVPLLQEQLLELGHRDEHIQRLNNSRLIEEVDLSFDQRIAAGSFGEVWRGRWSLLPNQTVAIKKMFITASNFDDVIEKGIFGDPEM